MFQSADSLCVFKEGEMDIKKSYARLRHRKGVKRATQLNWRRNLRRLKSTIMCGREAAEHPPHELSHDRAVAEFSGIVVDNTDVPCTPRGPGRE